MISGGGGMGMASVPASNMGMGGTNTMGGGGSYGGANSVVSNGLSPNQNQVRTKREDLLSIAFLWSSAP